MTSHSDSPPTNGLSVEAQSSGPSTINDEEGEEDKMIASMKVVDVLRELLKSPIPDCNVKRNKKLENRVLKGLNIPYVLSWREKIAIVKHMAEYALTRSNLEVWNQLASSRCGNYILRQQETNYMERVYQKFGDDVLPSLRKVLNGLPFCHIDEPLRKMRSYASQSPDVTNFDKWRIQYITFRVKAEKSWDYSAMEIVRLMVQLYGIRCFADMRCVVDHSVGTAFSTGFVRYLLDNRDDISSSPAEQLDSDNSVGEIVPLGVVIDRLVHRWLTAASNYVNSLYKSRKDVEENDNEFTGNTWPFETLVELCLKSGELEICRNILNGVLEATGEEISMLYNFQVPIACRLRSFLREFSFSVYSPPFAHFFRQVIERYSRVLGSRTHNPQINVLLRRIKKKFNCDCDDCEKLSEFMNQVFVPQKIILVSQRGYRHLHGYGMAKFKRVNSPHGICLKVTKSKIFQRQRWDKRVKGFRDFLSVIGDEEVIAKLMEERYANLKDTIKG